MSDLSVFFAQSAAIETTEDFAVSDRFKDANGKPVEWKLRSITEEENERLRKAATRITTGKNGVKTQETDSTEYLANMAAASVVFPNLKDAALQESYGVRGETAVLRKMLRPGEYGTLVQKIQELNGFDKTINDLKEEVKN